MAQEFYINKDATLPILKMELINDGKYNFNKFHEFIQNSTITFTMTNVENGVIKVASKPAFLQPKDGCDEEYFICYAWSEKDTKLKGKYNGKFTIVFGEIFGGGTLIVPIQEELLIYIQ